MNHSGKHKGGMVFKRRLTNLQHKITGAFFFRIMGKGNTLGIGVGTKLKNGCRVPVL